VQPLAERTNSPATRIAFVVMMISLSVYAVELGLKYLNWPRPVASGWRTTTPGQVNQFGWRGEPRPPRRTSDFVVVVTGGAGVECLACPPNETLDMTLERALHSYNPNVRVVTLGASGYGQDQEYLALKRYFAHERADLVISWASVADDVPANTFRSGQKRPGQFTVKPTFVFSGKDIRGPTEEIGQFLYSGKLWGLVRPWLIDIDRNWTIVLPKPDPGADSAPEGIATRVHVGDALEEQNSAWSIWLRPRPARVKYGIDLTHALLRHMQSLSALRGARFMVLLTPSAADLRVSGAVALEHGGHWFMADPPARDAAVLEVTDGFDTITLAPEGGELKSPEAERRVMARLAEALNERNRLAQVALDRPRR
jgi:hypothetical protein